MKLFAYLMVILSALLFLKHRFFAGQWVVEYLGFWLLGGATGVIATLAVIFNIEPGDLNEKSVSIGYGTILRPGYWKKGKRNSDRKEHNPTIFSDAYRGNLSTNPKVREGR